MAIDILTLDTAVHAVMKALANNDRDSLDDFSKDRFSTDPTKAAEAMAVASLLYEFAITIKQTSNRPEA